MSMLMSNALARPLPGPSAAAVLLPLPLLSTSVLPPMWQVTATASPATSMLRFPSSSQWKLPSPFATTTCSSRLRASWYHKNCELLAGFLALFARFCSQPPTVFALSTTSNGGLEVLDNITHIGSHFDIHLAASAHARP